MKLYRTVADPVSGMAAAVAVAARVSATDEELFRVSVVADEAVQRNVPLFGRLVNPVTVNVCPA